MFFYALLAPGHGCLGTRLLLIQVVSFLFKDFNSDSCLPQFCSWAADQVVGPPRVYPRYGDIQGSWAQGNHSDDEWIEVSQQYYVLWLYSF